MVQGRRPHECVKLEPEDRMIELHQGPSGNVGQCPTIPSQEEARKDSSLDVQGAHDMDFSLPTCKMNFCCFHQMFGKRCLVTTTVVNECTIVPALSGQVPEIQKTALNICKDDTCKDHTENSQYWTSIWPQLECFTQLQLNRATTVSHYSC